MVRRPEMALELIEPCCETSDKYRPWVERIFLRLRELSERQPEERRLEKFLGKRAVEPAE
jgi:hypothetical protein